MGVYDEDLGHSRFPLWLFVLGLCGGGVAYFWAQADHVTATALAAVTIAGFGGYRMGAARLCGYFGGLALAVVFAPTYGRRLEPHLADFLGTDGFANRAISIGVTGMGILLLVAITTRLLAYWLLTERPLLQGCNRWCGFSLGAVQGCALVLLLLGGLLIVEPSARRRVQFRMRSGNSELGDIVARRVVGIAEQTRRSALAPWVDEYNPFQRIPQLKRLQRKLRELSDPQRLNRLAGQRGQTHLQTGSPLMRAISELREDPQLRSLIDSGEPMDRWSALSLLDNPTIMKMLDQPELLSELSQLYGETGSKPHGASRP